jgi:general secretion pathway protein D
MRKLLTAALLVPVLALAQAAEGPGPASPAPAPAEPAPATAQPPRPAPLRAGVPVAPPAPGVRSPVPPRPAVQAPAPPRPSVQAPAPVTASGTPRAAGTAPAPPAAARAVAPSPPAGRPPPPAPAPGARASGPAPAEAQVPPGQAGGTARAEGACQPLQGRFLLAFNKADIVDILEQASRWTCRNFAYTEEVVRGKITLLSKTAVSPDEAYAAFLAALTANGIAMYQTGKYWKLVRIADSKKVPIPTLVGDEAEYAAIEQPITRVFRLRYLDPDQLRAVLGNFTSPQGADIQTVQPDVLLITDISLNVRRIEKLLEALDRPGSNDLVRVIQVQYAPARDIADKVNQIFTQVGGGPGKPGQKRQLIGGVATPGQPGAPVAAPAVAGGGAEPSEISISKVVADERTNKLIVISDEKSYQRIVELVKQLDTPTAGEGTIHVIYLKNANAEDLANTLQSLTTGTSRRSGSVPGAAPTPLTPTPPGQPAPRGPASAELFSGDVKITADKPSNSLVVVASASDFAVVQRLIDKLDRPRRQVFVEAVLMEINVSDDTKIGVGMHYAIPVNTAQGKGFIPLGLEPGRVNSLNPGSALQLGGFLTGLVGPVSAELKDIFPFPSMAVFIQAIQTNSDVNILSTPHLLAQDNEESEIIVGQNVPFQAGYNPGFSPGLGATGTTGATANNLLASPYAVSLIAPIQRQNVDLKLKIKPQIHEGDMIRLDIDEQAEEIVARDPQLGPTTAKRSVKTKVVAKDQSTIVIGGLIQDRNVTAVQKVPLLGDIPLLGWLFRDTVTSKQKTNLLLFLTPYIVRDQADFRRILERKQREQREFYEQYYGKKMGITMAEAAPRPGPLTRVRREVQTETSRIDNGGSGAPGEKTLGPATVPPPSVWQEPPPAATASPPRAVAPPGDPPPGPAAPAPGAE